MFGRTRTLPLLMGALALGALGALGGGGVAAAGHGDGKQQHRAHLRAVPHDPMVALSAPLEAAARRVRRLVRIR